MERIYGRLVSAAALAGLIAAAGAAQVSRVDVSVKPGRPGIEVVLVTAAMNQGKHLATTDEAGRASFDPLSVVMNSGKLDVIEETCRDGRQRVLLADPSLSDDIMAQQDGCKRKRRAGAFWWGRDGRLAVNFGGGFWTPRNGAILGGAGAAVVGIGVGAGGGGETSPSNPTSPTPTPTPSPGTNVTLFCGSFRAHVTPTQVGCQFTTTFDGPFNLTCNADGSGQLVFGTDNPSGQQFTYTGRVSSDGTLDFSGSGTLAGVATFNGRLTGRVSADGRSVTAVNTVTFTEPSCAGQVLVQQVTASR